MENRVPVTVYSLENCPNCDLLKAYLKEEGLEYTEENMERSGPLTELRMHGVFVLEAPVLRVGSTFLVPRDLFPGGKLDRERVGKLLRGGGS